MKRKHDFLCIFAVVAFMLVFHHVLLCGQTSGVKPGIRFIRIAKTSDVLYTNDSTYFLMDRSPLEKFPDYKKLYEKYKDKNFVIVGFPANNFGAQEPGSNSEIATFCLQN